MKLLSISSVDTPILTAIHQLAITPSWSQDEFQSLLSNPIYSGWLAVEEEKPVGFILASLLKPEAEILTLVVLPSYQQKGIGSLLLSKLKNYCTENSFSKIFLEVDQHNSPAQRMYLTQGFSQAGIRKNYYKLSSRKFSDAILMELTI